MSAKERKQTLRVALDALKRRRQNLAFDANMLRLYNYETEHTIRSARQYAELTAAIAELEAALSAPAVETQGRLF